MSDFSRRERQILDILFEAEEATAAQIREAMEDAPADATVRTLLRVLLEKEAVTYRKDCLLYTSPSPRDKRQSRMPSSA